MSPKLPHCRVRWGGVAVGQSGRSAQGRAGAAFGEDSPFWGALQATGQPHCASMNVKPHSPKATEGHPLPHHGPPQHSPRTWTTFFLPRALGGVSEARTPTSSSSAAQGPWGHIWGGERSHQHPPTPQHGGSITSDPPSPPRPGLTCRTPHSPPPPPITVCPSPVLAALWGEG